MVDGYARRRFKIGMAFSEAEVVAVEGYFYHILAANGSGEHALKHIFGPFALARFPLEGRMQALKVMNHTKLTMSVSPGAWHLLMGPLVLVVGALT